MVQGPCDLEGGKLVPRRVTGKSGANVWRVGANRLCDHAENATRTKYGLPSEDLEEWTVCLLYQSCNHLSVWVGVAGELPAL